MQINVKTLLWYYSTLLTILRYWECIMYKAHYHVIVCSMGATSANNCCGLALIGERFAYKSQNSTARTGLQHSNLFISTLYICIWGSLCIKLISMGTL